MPRTIIAGGMLIALSFSAGVAVADDGMRCGSKLIQVGMMKGEVLHYCGEPTSKSTEQVDVRSGNQVVGTTTRYTWTYKTYSATRVLHFDQAKLVAIE